MMTNRHPQYEWFRIDTWALKCHLWNGVAYPIPKHCAFIRSNVSPLHQCIGSFIREFNHLHVISDEDSHNTAYKKCTSKDPLDSLFQTIHHFPKPFCVPKCIFVYAHIDHKATYHSIHININSTFKISQTSSWGHVLWVCTRLNPILYF